MVIKEWIKKDDVMDIIKGLPQDLWEEYIYMLKGVWCDEDMKIETVVHCRDCQYNEWCIPKQGRSENDYCSRGKRREP